MRKTIAYLIIIVIVGGMFYLVGCLANLTSISFALAVTIGSGIGGGIMGAILSWVTETIQG